MIIVWTPGDVIAASILGVIALGFAILYALIGAAWCADKVRKAWARLRA
jgi:cell shape-determining protein MreD